MGETHELTIYNLIDGFTIWINCKCGYWFIADRIENLIHDTFEIEPKYRAT